MSTCPNCAADVDTTWRYCLNCGGALAPGSSLPESAEISTRNAIPKRGVRDTGGDAGRGPAEQKRPMPRPTKAILVVLAVVATAGLLALVLLLNRNGDTNRRPTQDAHSSLKLWEAAFDQEVDGAELSFKNSNSSDQSLCFQMGINFGSPGDLDRGTYPLDLWPSPDRHLNDLLRSWLSVHQQSYADCVDPLPVQDGTYQDIEDYLASQGSASALSLISTFARLTSFATAPEWQRVRDGTDRLAPSSRR